MLLIYVLIVVTVVLIIRSVQSVYEDFHKCCSKDLNCRRYYQQLGPDNILQQSSGLADIIVSAYHQEYGAEINIHTTSDYRIYTHSVGLRDIVKKLFDNCTIDEKASTIPVLHTLPRDGKYGDKNEIIAYCPRTHTLRKYDSKNGWKLIAQKHNLCEGQRESYFVLYCQIEPLMAAFYFRTSRNSSFILGFYGTKCPRKILVPRKYRVKLWKLDDNGEMYLESVFTTEGHLKSITPYAYRDDWIHGIYFTIDGNACFFKKNITHLQKGNLNFENVGVTRKPCFAFEEFVGCQRPFCFDPRFESSFTLTSVGKIFFIAGEYLFEAFIPGDNQLVDISMFVNATKTQFLFHFTDCPRCYKYRDFKASFTIYDPNKYESQLIFIFNEYDASFNECRYFSSNNSFSLKTRAAFIKSALVDAAWFSRFSERLYIFSGKRYILFQTTKLHNKRTIFEYADIGFIADLGIYEDYIDAVASIGQRVYFFTKGWFYKGSDLTGEISSEKYSAFTHFFNIETACFVDDKNSFLQARKRFSIEQVTTQTTVTPITLATKKRKSIPFKWIIIALILITAAILVLFIFMLKRKKKAVTLRKTNMSSVAFKKRATTTTGESISTFSTAQERTLTGMETTSVTNEPVHLKTIGIKTLGTRS